MKKGIFIVLAISAIVAISQWPTPTEEALIEKSSVVDTPEVLGSSPKTILAKSVNDEVQEVKAVSYTHLTLPTTPYV